MFVDSHAHLDSSDFDSDLEHVLERAAQASVSSVLVIGCAGGEGNVPQQVIRLVEEHENLLAGPRGASSRSASFQRQS